MTPQSPEVLLTGSPVHNSAEHHALTSTGAREGDDELEAGPLPPIAQPEEEQTQSPRQGTSLHQVSRGGLRSPALQHVPSATGARTHSHRRCRPAQNFTYTFVFYAAKTSKHHLRSMTS